MPEHTTELSTLPYFGISEPIEQTLNLEIERPDLERLLDQGVSERVIIDQVLVANRVNNLLGGFRGRFEDFYFLLGKNVSGNDRHSLVLMCSYGDGSPLEPLGLGRYSGNDFLKGNPIDLMGDACLAKKTLQKTRSMEGMGALVINGHFNLYHSGAQLPNVDLNSGDYQDHTERGSKTEAMLAFSKRHPTYGENPVWFYKLNGKKSIIQNGTEYVLNREN